MRRWRKESFLEIIRLAVRRQRPKSGVVWGGGGGVRLSCAVGREDPFGAEARTAHTGGSGRKG